MHFVVIGNGVAGINAAITIRERDSDSSITVISNESDHFFSRTALMYAFCGQLSRRDLEPFERNFYEKMRFTRVRDEAVQIEKNSKSITLKSGMHLSYDKLLIASGSKGMRFPWPGLDLEGVSTFVTLQDLDRLERLAKGAKKAVVVGGGLIGVEVAEILNHAGINTTFLIREKWYWPIALNRIESEMVAEHMREHHIDVRLETEMAEITGKDGRVTGVKTKSGDNLECDLVVLSIGVGPNTEFLKSSGLAMDSRGGVVVDEFQNTGDPHIYAAGDCASVTWFDGSRRPEQLWYTSRDQGRLAGRNMLGDQVPYKRGILYNSAKLFDIEYTTAGLVNFEIEGQKEWYQRIPGTWRSQRIIYKDGAVIGFNMLGSRWDHTVLMDFIAERRSPKWVLENLHRAQFDSEFSPKFQILQQPNL
jgi:NAD(P)H-nitrite reductase large subunit